jgi:hypothetical protein
MLLLKQPGSPLLILIILHLLFEHLLLKFHTLQHSRGISLARELRAFLFIVFFTEGLGIAVRDDDVGG